MNCARHVFMNWKKSHNVLILKKQFWRIVNSTYLGEYNALLDGLKKDSIPAYEDFIGRDTTKFCKVFINPSSVSDMILNNTSETFNGYILQSRGKHVIHMLEEIRTSLMVRHHRKNVELSDYHHRICPEIVKKLEKLKNFSRYCIPHQASEVIFEVENFGDRFVVDIRSRTCTCRAWDITGIPCKHACSVIHLLRQDVADYVHKAYSVERYKLCYLQNLPPLNGEKMWPQANGFPVVPPPVQKMPGRPKKKLKKKPLEENPTKLRRTGIAMTCSVCFQKGHNKKTCKNEKVVKPPKPKGKPGRPRKDSTQVSVEEQSSRLVSNASPLTQTQSTASTSETPRMETMGAAGRIFGTLPASMRPIFFPTAPQRTRKAKKKEKQHPTQGSQT